jgi:hypothetical protein
MTNAWQRRRMPEEVPTPVAVAVSDFCRRAGAPASAAEVRDALSLLSEEEDFRVRALTDGEPRSKPLGPWAVVDMLRGASESLAATRQSCGFYALARALADDSVARPMPEPSSWTPPAPRGGSKRKEKTSRLTIADRIAPKKRSADDASALAPLPALEPQRQVPRAGTRPKGRFAQISPHLESVDDLFHPEVRDALDARLEQYPDRFALTRALGDQYGGRREGQPLRTEDVERALCHHGLLDKLAHKEREAILGAYTEQRGATSRVAFVLALTMPELNRLLQALGISEQIEEIRERFRREALSPKHLGARLDLLGRGKYLADLGIRRRFDEALKSDFRKLLHQHAGRARDARELFELAARHEATQPELFARAAEKLGLSDDVRRLFPGEAGDDTPYAS